MAKKLAGKSTSDDEEHQRPDIRIPAWQETEFGRANEAGGSSYYIRDDDGNGLIPEPRRRRVYDKDYEEQGDSKDQGVYAKNKTTVRRKIGGAVSGGKNAPRMDRKR